MNLWKFDNLWYSPDNCVVVEKDELKAFIKAHTNSLGNTFIIVNGRCRKLKWKSMGLGLYKVSTESQEK